MKSRHQDELNWHTQCSLNRHLKEPAPMIQKTKRSQRVAKRQRAKQLKTMAAGLVTILCLACGAALAAHDLAFIAGGL